LEATDVDFRRLHDRRREVAVLLLVLGAIRILLGALLFFTGRDTLAAGAGAPIVLVAVDLFLGSFMIVAARSAQQRPTNAATTVLAAWIVTQVLVLAVSPLRFVTSLIGRILVSIGLGRALIAARASEALHTELVRRQSGDEASE